MRSGRDKVDTVRRLAEFAEKGAWWGSGSSASAHPRLHVELGTSVQALALAWVAVNPNVRIPHP